MTYRFLMTAFLTSAAAVASAQNAATPAPAQQPIARAAYLQRVDGNFVAIDANKDGFMDRAEIEVAETKVLNARKAALLRQREAAFRKLDTNKDGSLSLQEYNALLAGAPVKANAAPILGRLDTNKDGKVSLAENRAPAMAQFDRADTNKDGSLSPAELKARGNR